MSNFVEQISKKIRRFLHNQDAE